MKTLLLIAFVFALRLSAQTHYLLHVDVTCGPYGLGECWSTIRSGLERMDGIVWVSDQANVTNKTGEFIVSPSRVVTAKEVDILLRSHRITADVQGLEVVAAGANQALTTNSLYGRLAEWLLHRF